MAAARTDPDATSSPDTADAIPGFREACLDVLHLLSVPVAGSYQPDEDLICKRVAYLKGRGTNRRAISGMHRLAVALYCAAVRGQRGAMKEFLDRCEGSVAQRVQFDIRRRAAEIAERIGVTPDELLAEAAAIAEPN